MVIEAVRRWLEGHGRWLLVYDNAEDPKVVREALPRAAWGLYDMHGNLREWVEDCWHDSYANAPEDGRAWLEENGGNCSSPVLRGGSWGSDARSARRDWSSWLDRSYYIGFRVVCSSPSLGPSH